MKRFASIILCVVMLFSLATSACAADNSYTDVRGTEWYAEAVAALREKGIMDGVGDNRFDPEGVGAADHGDIDVNTDVDAGGMGDMADGSVDVGADVDVSGADHPGTGMNLLTFRNFINFLLGFGWSAVLLTEIPWGWRIVIAVAIGCGLVALVMYLFKWLSHMQQSGNINVYKSAVGCTGTTYLTIPGARKGEGKVQITIAGAVREYGAVTDGDTLPTGTRIRVVEVVDPSTLLVEEINSLIV